MKKVFSILLACLMLVSLFTAQAASTEFPARATSDLLENIFGLTAAGFDWDLFESVELKDTGTWTTQGLLTACLFVEIITADVTHNGVRLGDYMDIVDGNEWNEIWVIYHGVPGETGYRLEWFVDAGDGYLQLSVNPAIDTGFFNYYPYEQGKVDLGGMCATLYDLVLESGVPCGYGRVSSDHLNNALISILEMVSNPE